MRRLLSTLLVLVFALASAPLASAERGDWWRSRGEHHGGEHHDKHDGPPPDRRGPPGNYRPPNDGPGADERDDRRNDRNYPGFGRREHDRARDGVMRGRMVPLEDLENRIARSTPGFRIGNPEFMMYGGRPIYRIRWRAPDGHILIVFADAETGQVIDIRGR